MESILLDINVFLDVLSARAGFDSSAKIIDSVEKKEIFGVISALTIPILWYITSETLKETKAKEKVEEITKGFKIQELDEEIIKKAFCSSMKDFEDSIQYYSAKSSNCTTIVTRNKKDFKELEEISIQTPEEFLEGQ
jgi:predicted nucleic acid-binding protein